MISNPSDGTPTGERILVAALPPCPLTRFPTGLYNQGASRRPAFPHPVTKLASVRCATMSPATPRNHGRIAALVLAAALAAPARAEAPDGDGVFITVPNPLTSEAVNHIEGAIGRAVERSRAGPERRPLTVVLDFNPAGEG